MASMAIRTAAPNQSAVGSIANPLTILRNGPDGHRNSFGRGSLGTGRATTGPPAAYDSKKRKEAIVRLNTYVNFAGRCAKAFRYYEQHLGARIRMMMTHGEGPGPSRLPPEWKDAVLHARLELGDSELMGADIPDAQPMRSGYLTLTVDSDGEAERIFTALAQGGEVFMPLQETFFATRFGQCRDRFGINWMIMRERPAADGARGSAS